MGTTNFKKIGYTIYFSGLLLALQVLVILPADFFDRGQSLCLSVLLLDTKCPGCGITRAIQHLIHLDFQQAAQYNKLSFVVLPILLYLLIREIITVYAKLKTFRQE